MVGLVQHLMRPLRVRQFFKFCVVGSGGVVVDMGVLHVLAVWLGWNLTLSKVCAAEAAMLNNFLWNEVWTFRASNPADGSHADLPRRLWRFHAICGVGIFLAVLLLHFFHTGLSLNLYAANLLAIGLVTLWNFGLNVCFNWSGRG